MSEDFVDAFVYGYTRSPRRIRFDCYHYDKTFTKEELESFKVLYNPPATILWVNGEKFISKAHNEEFDKEKGLLMCIAKAVGISHLQLKKMINSAKVQEKKED